MYVRITRFRPIEHWRNEVIEELDSYMEWLKSQPGFSYGLRLFSLHHPDEVARLTVWENRSYADHAATTEHALAARSAMLGMTMDQAIHEEEFDEQPLYVEASQSEEPDSKEIEKAALQKPDVDEQILLRSAEFL